MAVTSGDKYKFVLREDLSILLDDAQPHEVDLHGTFVQDIREGYDQSYFIVPNFGLVEISPDLTSHHQLPYPDELQDINIHSLKMFGFDSEVKFVLTANETAQIFIMSLDGNIEHTIERPTLKPYDNIDTEYKPTDVTLHDHKLYVADGYAANYISVYNLKQQEWVSIFGGHTEDHLENGKFRTAHGITITPNGESLHIVDRWNSRIQQHAFDGTYQTTYRFPHGCWVCGVHTIKWQGKQLSVIANLYDTDEDKKRPAPIYICESDEYELVSIIRPKEELGIEFAQRMHNVRWHIYDNQLFLLCQSWNPGKFFVLELEI